jgi:catechol 2,3-dioxygenase-like lactoylglutathione lyase family enzyme
MIKLNHTAFYVSDLNKALEFFGHLGFKEKRRIEVIHLKTILCFVEDSEGGVIEFMHIADRCEVPGCKPSAFGYAHIGMETDDIKAEEARLKAAGIHYREPIRQVGDGPKIALIDGPDGITVEVVEYPKRD